MTSKLVDWSSREREGPPIGLGPVEDLVLHNHLKEARREKGYSQGHLAEMVGVSRQTISSLETGQFSPTARLALLLCHALDWEFEELFYLEKGE